MIEALTVLEVMRRVLRCILQAVDGEPCLLEVLEVLEVMRSMLLCMLEAVERKGAQFQGFEMFIAGNVLVTFHQHHGS